MARDWGPWTIIKLEALEGYYSGFTTASKSADRTLYLDLFGGRPDNRERTTERVFPGSAVRAAEADPPFTRLIVSELNVAAASAQAARLEKVTAGRARVIPGDCNVVIPAALDALIRDDPDWRWAPTFALVDQYSAEVRWETLATLARFKHPRAKTKAELCMYFGESFMVRGLVGAMGRVNAAYAARLDEMYGDRSGWRKIAAARDDDVLTGAQAQRELVNLMRWRLERELGYSTTLPLQVRNTIDRNIFSLIFATDHPVGSRIMQSLFDGAENKLDSMVEQRKFDKRIEREQAIGDISLFDEATERAIAMPRAPRARPPTAPPVAPFEYHRLWERDG